MKNETKDAELEQLKKDYKYLEDKYENLLKEYDMLLQAYYEALQTYNLPDGKNCENDLISDCAELSMKNDRLEWWYKTLNQALDIKEELNKALRQENEELKNKLRATKNDR